MIASTPARIDCYWVWPGRFLAGEYPARVDRPDAAKRLDAILAAGIDTFVDLTDQEELSPYLPLLLERARRRGIAVTHQRFAIVDFDLPEPSTMQAILDAIEIALRDGHRLYLHCRGGLGRTGMAVGCYLVRQGHTGQEALGQIQDSWAAASKRRSIPMSPETPAQVQFVLDWRKHDRSSA